MRSRPVASRPHTHVAYALDYVWLRRANDDRSLSVLHEAHGTRCRAHRDWAMGRRTCIDGSESIGIRAVRTDESQLQRTRVRLTRLNDRLPNRISCVEWLREGRQLCYRSNCRFRETQRAKLPRCRPLRANAIRQAGLYRWTNHPAPLSVGEEIVQVTGQTDDQRE
jgi:hypothetical protein